MARFTSYPSPTSLASTACKSKEVPYLAQKRYNTQYNISRANSSPSRLAPSHWRGPATWRYPTRLTTCRGRVEQSLRLLLNWLGYALFYNSSRSHNFSLHSLHDFTSRTWPHRLSGIDATGRLIIIAKAVPAIDLCGGSEVHGQHMFLYSLIVRVCVCC